jgi:hypothetical protein
MMRSRHPLRASLASLAGAILLLQGLLVPALEADGSTRRAVLESQHSAGNCVVGHDHTICLQVGANRSATPVGAHPPIPVVALVQAGPRSSAARPELELELTKHPRGPPSA